jgi:hypothetical protein
MDFFNERNIVADFSELPNNIVLDLVSSYKEYAIKLFKKQQHKISSESRGSVTKTLIMKSFKNLSKIKTTATHV